MSVVLESAHRDPFDEDIVLVDRVLMGDEDAFERLYERYYDRVYSVARGILLDSDEALDAVQEIFTLVFRNLKRFDRRSRFGTWLFRIAVNRSIQESRRLRHKHKWVELNEAAERPAPPTQEEDPDPRIQHAMSRLSPQDRALITLFYWQELNLAEIAESVGSNVNAVKTRLYRARERFREHYEEEEN